MQWISMLFAVLAGGAMSVQGVINTRLSEKIGLFESNAYVQGTAFLLSLLTVILFGKGNFSALFSARPIYLFGGVLGLGITVFVMLAMKDLSPTVAVSIILIAQLLIAGMIDYFGILGTTKTAFHWQKLLGLALMISGVILFKKS